MKTGTELAGETAVSPPTLIEYHRQPLPSPLDDELRGVIAAWTALPAVEREAFIGALPHSTRNLFGIYGHRAATIAVRQDDPDWLRSGLLGTVIANDGMDNGRKIALALAVPQHCAIKLKLDLVELFTETAVYAHPPLADHIKSASSTLLSLRTYGWRELKTADGLKYKHG